MKRKLIIDGNAVYEIDEDCMVRQRLQKAEESKEGTYLKVEQKGQINRVEK